LELIKRELHLDKIKNQITTQITIDDDFNIPDSLGDVYKILFDHACIQLDEVKVSDHHIAIRGNLVFSVLYQAEKHIRPLQSVEGKIPFDEFIHMNGAQATDDVKVFNIIENLSVTTINSRKLSIRSVIRFLLFTEQIEDTEIVIDIKSEELLESQRKETSITEQIISKKDIYRIKDTLQLPANLENIDHLLWYHVEAGTIQYKADTQRIQISGNLQVFLIYDTQNDDSLINYYETLLPFSGEIDAQQCAEHTLLDMEYEIGSLLIEVKPDRDGEDREIAIDLVFNLDIKGYEEQNIELITDVYGVTKDVTSTLIPVNYKKFLFRNQGKCKIEDQIAVKNKGCQIEKVCYCFGMPIVEHTKIKDEKILIEGVVELQVLYQTDQKQFAYDSDRSVIPFEFPLNIPGIHEGCIYSIQSNIENLSAQVNASGDIEITGMLNLQSMVFESLVEQTISTVEVDDLDMTKMEEMPGMVGYIVKDGETLWSIGKKYCVGINQIKELSELKSNDVKAGDRLLIMKTIGQNIG